jgi:hypothetical protein
MFTSRLSRLLLTAALATAINAGVMVNAPAAHAGGLAGPTGMGPKSNSKIADDSQPSGDLAFLFAQVRLLLGAVFPG